MLLWRKTTTNENERRLTDFQLLLCFDLHRNQPRPFQKNGKPRNSHAVFVTKRVPWLSWLFNVTVVMFGITCDAWKSFESPPNWCNPPGLFESEGDHEILSAKLEHLLVGITNSLVAWSRSFLIGRSLRVVVEGMESTPTRVRSGVPQGTVFGPLFFLVYINDISSGLSQGTILKLFADDSLLYRIIRTPRDTQILQNDLNLLQLLAEKNKMEFHMGKCQLLKITN